MTVIGVSGVSKAYRLGSARYGTLRETIMGRLSPRRSVRDDSVHWALRNVDFEIRGGECVGVIGPNGAGKSTLLKIISRITRPTEGSVSVRGRVASLIEVGAGFHPELTGRENLALYGSILGMSRRTIQERAERIVAYAELAKFIDVPLKRYSSGMHVRLGFATAIHSDADVLLMDEVLAVGDIAFQQKCLRSFEEIRDSGRTIVLVSHNLRAVEAMCHRAIWIREGRVREDGDAATVVERYLRDAAHEGESPAVVQAGAPTPETVITLVSGSLEDPVSNQPVSTIRTGDPLRVRVRFSAHQRVVHPTFAINIYSATGAPLISASMVVDGRTPDEISGPGAFACVFESVPLLPGRYLVAAGAGDATGSHVLALMQQLTSFTVEEVPPTLLALAGPSAATAVREGGPVLVPYRWEATRG